MSEGVHKNCWPDAPVRKSLSSTGLVHLLLLNAAGASASTPSYFISKSSNHQVRVTGPLGMIGRSVIYSLQPYLLDCRQCCIPDILSTYRRLQLPVLTPAMMHNMPQILTPGLGDRLGQQILDLKWLCISHSKMPKSGVGKTFAVQCKYCHSRGHEST